MFVSMKGRGKNKQCQIYCPGYSVLDCGRLSNVFSVGKQESYTGSSCFSQPPSERLQYRHVTVSSPAACGVYTKPACAIWITIQIKKCTTSSMFYLDGRRTVTRLTVMRPPIPTEGFQPCHLHCFTSRFIKVFG